MKRYQTVAGTLVLLAAPWLLLDPATIAAQAPVKPPCGPDLPVVTRPTAPTNLRIIKGAGAEPDAEFPSGPSAESADAAEPGADAGAAVAGPHDYFNALSLRPDCQVAYSLRDLAQIMKYRYGLYDAKVTYDFAHDPHPQKQDAAKWTFKTNDLNGEQMRLPISLIRPATGSSKILIISDHWWDDQWLTEFWYDLNGTRTQMDGWKWLQVTDNLRSPTTAKQGIWFEPNMRWIGWDAGILSWFGARGYGDVKAPTVKGGDRRQAVRQELPGGFHRSDVELFQGKAIHLDARFHRSRAACGERLCTCVVLDGRRDAGRHPHPAQRGDVQRRDQFRILVRIQHQQTETGRGGQWPHTRGTSSS